MSHYIELQLLPSDEVNLGFIWQKVFQQVHIALVEHGYESERKLKHGNTKSLRNSNIAVSFPEYQNHAFPLGSKLRLFANTQAELEKLNIQAWLNRLTDYVNVEQINPVPQDATKVVFKQKRFKGEQRLAKSNQKKIEHLKEKFGSDFNPEYEKLSLPNKLDETRLPFIQLESQTTRKITGSRGLFQIFIEKKEVGIQGGDKSGPSQYCCYGLALDETSTVPWF